MKIIWLCVPAIPGRMIIRPYDSHAHCIPIKPPRPRLTTRAGFDFNVETCHGASLRMGYGIIPCYGIRQQYP